MGDKTQTNKVNSVKSEYNDGMTDPDEQQLNDLSKAAITIFVMLGRNVFYLSQTHADNSEIGVNEIVTLTITRDPLTPVPVMVDDVWAARLFVPVSELVTV